jgi:salicylate hydroxylase
VNWVGIGPPPAADSAGGAQAGAATARTVRESWSATGSADALVRDHEGWHPQILDLLAATERPFLTLLYDRHPLPSWVRGRAVLLGDAAHAMLPYHAQGAVQSLEDAWVLASCLGREGPLDAALRQYESLRKDRATQVQAYSRGAQEWYHLSEPRELERRSERFRAPRRRGPAGFSSQQEWLYAYDAELAARGEDHAWRAMRWRAE